LSYLLDLVKQVMEILVAILCIICCVSSFAFLAQTFIGFFALFFGKEFGTLNSIMFFLAIALGSGIGFLWLTGRMVLDAIR